MSELTKAQQFEQCLAQAREIVAAHRAEAPEGCDPQCSWFAIAGTVVSAGVSAYGVSQNNKNFKKSQAAQAGQFGDAQAYIDSLGAEEFGSPLDPEAFLYHPVDISQSQLDTISGNLAAFPSALQLTNQVNPEIWKNDLSRIRQMMPGFDNARDTYTGATQKLLQGELPFQDVEDIVSNRSTMAGMLGTPGGSRNATLRDLGLSRMDAIGQGGNMFQQFIQMAQAISPVESQMRPQQMFFTPQERLQADILQRSLEQQGTASAALAEAMPDPAANAKANANIGLMMAQMGGGGQQGGGQASPWGAIAQGIGGALSAYGASKSSTPSYGNQFANMNMTGGKSVGASPFAAQSQQSVAPPATVQSFNTNSGVSLSGQGTASFQPYANSSYYAGTNSAGMNSSLFPNYNPQRYGGFTGWYQ